MKKILLILGVYMSIGLITYEETFNYQPNICANNITCGTLENARYNISFFDVRYNLSNISFSYINNNLTLLWSNASNQEQRISNIIIPGLIPENNNITLLWSNASGQENSYVRKTGDVMSGQLNVSEIAFPTVINISTLAEFNLKVSGNNDKFLRFYTDSNIPKIMTVGTTPLVLISDSLNSGITSPRVHMAFTSGHMNIFAYSNASEGNYLRLDSEDDTNNYLIAYKGNLNIQANGIGSESITWLTRGNVTSPTRDNVEDWGSLTKGWKNVFSYTYVDLNNTDSELLKIVKEKNNKTSSQILDSIYGKITEDKESIKALYPILFFVCNDSSIMDEPNKCINGTLATGRNTGAWDALTYEAYQEQNIKIKNIEATLCDLKQYQYCF